MVTVARRGATAINDFGCQNGKIFLVAKRKKNPRNDRVTVRFTKLERRRIQLQADLETDGNAAELVRRVVLETGWLKLK
jgi:hypothetical protein